jgi:hypothetical protein
LETVEHVDLDQMKLVLVAELTAVMVETQHLLV